jgi:hypothetical protein
MNAKIIGALVLALAFAGLAGTMLWYRGNAIAAEAELDKKKAELALAVDANDTLKAALEREQKQNDINSRIVLGFSRELAKINETFTANTAERHELENTDEDVRDYLRAPVPDALRRLYDR